MVNYTMAKNLSIPEGKKPGTTGQSLSCKAYVSRDRCGVNDTLDGLAAPVFGAGGASPHVELEGLVRHGGQRSVLSRHMGGDIRLMSGSCVCTDAIVLMVCSYPRSCRHSTSVQTPRLWHVMICARLALAPLHTHTLPPHSAHAHNANTHSYTFVVYTLSHSSSLRRLACGHWGKRMALHNSRART